MLFLGHQAVLSGAWDNVHLFTWVDLDTEKV